MKIAIAVPEPCRASLSAEVKCIAETPMGSRSYVAMNVSEGGLFLRTHFPLKVGTRLRCTFQMPDGRPPVEAAGEVAWVRTRNRGPARPPGMGVRFDAITPKDKRRARAYVAGIRQLGFC